MSEQTVKSNITETSKKVEETFDMVEQTKFGKIIPLTIPKLDIIKIVKILFIIKICYVAPYYLILNSGTSVEINFFERIDLFFKSLNTYILLGDLIFGAAEFFLRNKLVLILIVAFSAFKFLAFILLTFYKITHNLSFLNLLFYLIFIVAFLGIDFLYAFYMHIMIKENIKDNSIPEIDAKEDENI